MKVENIVKITSMHGNEGEFFVRSGTLDEFIINSLWKEESYFSDGYIPQENDIVIDIGASIGAFSIEAALFGAEVWSYEPWPETFEMLKRNIMLNKVEKRVHALMQGVYSRRTKMKMWESSKGHGGNTLYMDYFCTEKYLMVDLIGMNDLLKNFEEVDFLKMDCEGCEKDIVSIANMENVKAIILEWHKLENGIEILKQLKAKGFNVTYEKKYHRNLGLIKAKR